MEDSIDAFLYLGPQDLRLTEKMPADIALDVDFRMESQRDGAMLGFPDAATETLKQFDQQMVKSAENPLFAIHKERPDSKDTTTAVQSCLDAKSHSTSPPKWRKAWN